MVSATAERSSAISVRIDPAAKQDSYPRYYDRIYAHGLRGIAELPGRGQRKLVELIFRPTEEWSAPQGILQLLSSRTVEVSKLAWFPSSETYVGVPDEQALRRIAATFDIDNPFVRVPDEMERDVFQDIMAQTDFWYTQWKLTPSLLTVIQSRDPYMLLDQQKFVDALQRQRAVHAGVSTLVNTSQVADALVSKIIKPGQIYDIWLEKMKDPGPGRDYQRLLSYDVRERHNHLYTIAASYPHILETPIGLVIRSDPYELGSGSRALDQTIKDLVTYSHRYPEASPERSLFAGLAVTTRVAREYQHWAEGYNPQGMFARINELTGSMAYIPAFLEALHSTEEGQNFSHYLEGIKIKPSLSI